MCNCTYSGVAGCPNCAPKASQPGTSQPETLKLTAHQVVIAARALSRQEQLMVVQDLSRMLGLYYPPIKAKTDGPPSQKCSSRKIPSESFQRLSYAQVAHNQAHGCYPVYYFASEVDEYFRKEVQIEEESATDRVERTRMVLELRAKSTTGMSCYPGQASCMRRAANLMEKQLCE